MPRIFISYSRRDKPLADYIAAQLSNRGAEVFVDYQRLVGGDNFIQRLGDAIASCDHVVVLLSPHAVNSPWVQAEIAWAFTNRKPIVPVLLETCSMLSLFVLTPLEQVDFTRWSLDGHVEEAVIQLAAALNLPAQPVNFAPVPALMAGDVLPDEPEETHAPLVIPREDLSDLFLMAAEVTETDPEQAMFLYQQIIEIDPHYMQGKAQDFVKRQENQLLPARLAQMLKRARAAIHEGRWQQAEQIAEDMLALDDHNADAEKMIQRCTLNAPGEPLYQQIVTAVQRDKIKAAEVLLRDFRQTYPAYGDPAKVIRAVYPVNLPLLEWCRIPHGLVPAFRISKYPITNAQYDAFLAHRIGYSDPYWWNFSPEASAWRAEHNTPSPGKFAGDRRPRESVCWFEAVAFCRWLSFLLGVNITLPTEAQWQWAAQGSDHRDYPWKGVMDIKKCNVSESRIGQTTDVDQYPPGASPFGVMDMAGNVCEWCLNDYTHPENTGLSGRVSRAIRGGSWAIPAARITARARNLPDYKKEDTGFRVVALPLL